MGGLTVFKALEERLPGENLVYFGDTAHVPYGSKSPKAVARYSVAVARFLARRGIKALVVACNTSSALALPQIRQAVAVPVIGVIAPGARAAAEASPSGRIGIIGTEATIASGAYTRELSRRKPGLRVMAKACPLFVPLIEEGWWSDDVAWLVARRYLKDFHGSGIDTLILGCTHYPLLKPVLRRVLGAKVLLIDSAEETARETERHLAGLGRLRSGRGVRRDFYVSDGPDRFLGLARRFLGSGVKRVRLEQIDA